MKPNDVATLLGIAVPTVRAWSSQYSRFLSPSGAGGRGRHRNFTDRDIRVLYFIKEQKKAGVGGEEIVLALDQLRASDFDNLPSPPERPNVAQVPMVPTAAANAALDAERRALLREIAMLQEMLDDKDQAIAQRDERIIDLSQKLARIEFELELYKAGRLKPE